MSDVLEELKVLLGADVSDYEKKMDRVAKAQKKVGDDLAEVGKQLTLKVTAPILAAAAAFTFMAAEEQAADVRLAQTLKNVGVNFDKVQDHIHGTISSLETMTSFNDTDVEDSFNKLIGMTKNYSQSLAALPVVADFARGAQLDLETATQLVGKGMNGNISTLKRYGIALAEGSTATEVLAQLQARFGGSAAAYANTVEGAFANLKNQAENFAEEIGKGLLPIAMTLIQALTKLALYGIQAAQAFNALPGSVKLITLSVVGLIAVVGPLVYAWGKWVTLGPIIINLFKGIGVTTLSVTAQVAIFAAVAAIVVANWESAKNTLKGIFYGIAGAVAFLVEGILRILEVTYKLVPGMSAVFTGLRTQVEGFETQMGDSFQGAAAGIVSPADAMKNTMDMLGAAWDSISAKFNQPLPPLKTGPAQSAWDSFTAHLKATSVTLSETLTGNIAGMVATMSSQLAQGTLDFKKVLLAFLIQTLEAIVNWAASAALAAAGLSQALAAAFANPLVAVAVIAGLVGVIYGLASSYQSSVAMATGGMTMGPTHALIGDNPSGAEVVLPLDSPRTTAALSKAMPEGGGMGEQTIILQLGDEEVARAAVRGMPSILRITGVSYGA